MERIQRKIKSCFALAKSATSNPNEAANALRQAQALMKKHGLSAADVHLSDVSAQQCQVAAGKTPPRHQTLLANLINQTFGVDCVFICTHNGNRWQSDIQFIGLGKSPELAAYCFSVLSRQLHDDRQRFYRSQRKQLKRQTRIRRADLYAQGWVRSAAELVNATYPSDEEKALINLFIERHHRHITPLHSRQHKIQRHDHNAYFVGVEDGKGIQLFHGVTTAGQARLSVEP